jgi:hypothetical protein
MACAHEDEQSVGRVGPGRSGQADRRRQWRRQWRRRGGREIAGRDGGAAARSREHCGPDPGPGQGPGRRANGPGRRHQRRRLGLGRAGGGLRRIINGIINFKHFLSVLDTCYVTVQEGS